MSFAEVRPGAPEDGEEEQEEEEEATVEVVVEGEALETRHSESAMDTMMVSRRICDCKGIADKRLSLASRIQDHWHDTQVGRPDHAARYDVVGHGRWGEAQVVVPRVYDRERQLCGEVEGYVE